MDHTRLSPVERGLLVLVLAISLSLRLTGLGVYATTDEDRWFSRSKAFNAALQRHAWAGTYQSGHPGVITMWLGTLAERLPLLERPWIADGLSEVAQGKEPAPGAGIPPLTLGARRLVAIVTWLGIVALYPLLRKLLDARSAAFATILVALDPFFLAHSRLHHLDALLTTFVALSVVCLLVYSFRGRQIGYLLASGAAAALAMANKSPGVLLGPWAGLALGGPVLLVSAAERKRELTRAAGALALWGLVAAAVVVAIWPAMWVHPLDTVKNVLGVAEYYAETPHEQMNYFWFAARADPGPAFYPVAWLFRATPWALLGLLALPFGKRDPERRLPLALLGCGALVFAAAMTVGAKKFDRYLLPAFPLLDVVAAVGWLALLRRALPRLAERWRRPALALAAAVLLATQLAWVWPAHPYYLSYYNPLFGKRAAEQVMLVGWGEGLDQLAGYMNHKPDAKDLVVCSWPSPEFGYFFVGKSVKDTRPVPLAELDYLIFYRSSLQRERVPVASRFLGVRQPERTLTLNGIDYAWLYENTLYDRAEHDVLAYVAARADPKQDMILLTVQATLARTYGGAVPLEVFRPWNRLDSFQVGLQRATAGRKHVWHLVYPDAQDGLTGEVTEALGREAAVGDEITVDGVRAVRYDLPPDPHFVPASPANPSGVRFGEQLTLAGYDLAQTGLTPGQPLNIRLHWQVSGPITRSYITFIHLIGPGGAKYGQLDSMPQGWSMPTYTWKAGERIVDDYAVDLSPEAPAGEYVAVIGMYDRETQKRLPLFDPAGNRLKDNVLILSGLRVADCSGP